MIRRVWKRFWCAHYWTRNVPLPPNLNKAWDEDEWYCPKCGKRTLLKIGRQPLNYLDPRP